MALKSNLHIETVLRNGRTQLRKTFCQPPFKIADVTEDKRQKELRLMLMNSSPGMLDGDEYNLRIDVGQGSSLSIETQSYQRLFQMRAGASQTMTVELHAGSCFTYLPHPSVPHKNAIFRAKNKILLNQGCSLIWGEVVSCGRQLNNEVFAFTFYQSLTEIFTAGKLMVKENLLLIPAEMNVQSIGQWEGNTHQATLLYLTEEIKAAQVADAIVEELDQLHNLVFGVSVLPVNGIIIRLLGHKAEELFALVKYIAGHLQCFQKSATCKSSLYV